MEKDEIKNSDNTGEDIEKSSVDKDLANDNDNEKKAVIKSKRSFIRLIIMCKNNINYIIHATPHKKNYIVN